MGEFFGNMNVLRFLILLSVLGSCVLGVLVWKQNEARDKVERERRTVGPKAVSEIIDLSHRYEQLEKLLSKEGLAGVQNPASYIHEIAAQIEVGIGSVDVTPSKQPVTSGVVDKTFKVDPGDRTRGYGRREIANFLYRLEEKSLTAKVTQLQLRPIGREKIEEPLADRWTFSATVTSREAE